MLFWARRVSMSKFFSSSLFHGHAGGRESLHLPCPASTAWFIKVVCTICIRNSLSLSVLDSYYFRESLDPCVAFGVVYHLNRLNNLELAFSFFRFSRANLNLTHLESTFDLLLRSLCGMCLYDSAKVVYDYMKADEVSLNSVAMDIVVLSFAKAGRLRIAEEILISKANFCMGKGEAVSPFVYNEFLGILISRNQVDDAVLFFRNHILRLRSLHPDVCSFNTVMRGLCLVGKIDEAFEFFDIMKNFGCHPDRVSYNTLINGLCRVGKLSRAEELLRELKVHPLLSPDVVTYTSIVSGYCKLSKTDNAAGLFDEMIENGVKPSLITFNVIIDGFGKNGEVASAIRMYERMAMDGIYPDVVTYTSLIDGHCRCGELQQGMKFWDEMKQRQVLPNLYTFSVLINSLCRENRLNEARDLLRQLSQRKDIIPKPFVYNPVIDGLCKAGNVDDANAIIVEMEAKGCVHDKMTFTILILGHCMKGRMFDAIEIYRKMMSVGCLPDNFATSSLISCLRKAGMVREANEIKQRALNSMSSDSSPSKRTMPVRANMNITVAA
ncbi:pentatricopeptide repeat-containing protein At2g06000 [Andrographis paniculata]|uniref:pentatricopeptide repeat-containing protein At2g06000 n=1 Tax=Andrographis paniculata TaxID=175694 RepID=UPI0021E8878D|nr:pentatricopeptide repeat-containing protein At2g06000 [Andrographis paniculata]XP_051147163.1 pentatricopeptide repeat-containing protein At2g06000 [Andrographis paniculata]